MSNELAQPDLIIGAGTGTHRLLLSLRRFRKAKTLVIMKPGFPLRLLDGAIIPAHDGIQSGERVFVTEGVINTITPLARITEKLEALILIGGLSPHYQWDNDVILGQINHLIGHYPQWRWTISGSRRTPEDLLIRLNELANPRITVVDPKTTHANWLNHRLAASKAVWVSPDSMSMVCEAATSGVPTGLFQLTEQPGSRVAKGVNLLIHEGRVGRWSDHVAVMAGKTRHNNTLWEADCAARWILNQGLLQIEEKTHAKVKRTTV
jgi:mitochondrial fission protein ELM1